jgi:hypothetical protein
MRRSRQPDAVLLASPEPGRSMTTKIEPLGNRVRQTALALEATLDVVPHAALEALAPRRRGLGFRLTQAELQHRVAWWLIGQWLTGYALNCFDERSTFEDAETWFYGDAEDMPRLAPPGSMREVGEMAEPEEVWALLPYLLDPLDPGTRRHVSRDVRQASVRATRKAGGIFYTPADLACWMTGQVVPELDGPWTCLDPACGSGVFLRAALERDRDAVPFGVDIVPAAAEAAAFVVLASTAEKWTHSPLRGWHEGRSRLATMDALDLIEHTEIEVPGEHRLGDVFPELVDGADAFLCNPPYTPLYPAFTELSWRTIGPRGRSSIVLPLAVAYHRGSHFSALRKAMGKAPGRWECSFFDRAPDALFGDDVKTRNCVLSFRAGEKGFAVTGLLRWTSRNRQDLFGSVGPVDLGLNIAAGIPKVSTAVEVAQLASFAGCEHRLADAVVVSGRAPATPAAAATWPHSVFVGATAYNWFNLLRDLRPAVDAGHQSASGFHALRFADSRQADAAYAVISSRVAFWLWRVEGDGFHVNKSFLLGLPSGLGVIPETQMDELARLGSALWAKSQAHSIVAVNGGRKTVAFPALAEDDFMHRLDHAVAEASGADITHHIDGLGNWYRKLVVVDDLDRTRNHMDSNKEASC